MQRARLGKYYLAASIALLAFFVYLPAFRNEFVNWDDDIYVYDNPHIRSLDAAFFRWAFLGFHISNWHPLTWMSHAIDYALWGLNPLGHHLTNIILHAINTGLVVVLVLKLFEIARERSAQNEPSAFLNDWTILITAGVTGLLFGIHPVHVESVAWVSERKDLLCALFFLLSVLAYANAVRRMGHGAESKRLTPGALLSALCFFILALLSKPMAVTLPMILLILDWYPLNRIRSWREFWSMNAEKLPFFAFSLASSVLTVLAQRTGGAMAAMEVVPLFIRTLVATESLIAYLGKILLPINLIPFYPYPRDVSLFSFEYLSAISLIAGITAACMVMVKKQRIGLSAWGYYVATLIPVLGIVQAGGQAMADRYTYLPSLGPFLIVGLMSAAVSEKAQWAHQRGRVVSITAVLFILISLLSLTVRQIGVWRTSMDLWNYVIQKGPDEAPLAYYNRGQIYMNRGQFGEAIEDYSMAIRLNPAYQEAVYNRGLAFEKSGQPDRAVEDYERAISLNPSNYQAFNNRGVLYGAAGSYDKAIEFFTRALIIKQEYPDAYFNRGITHTLTNRRDLALADFNKAIELNQQFAAAYLHRGKLLLGMDRQGAAAGDFGKACELGVGEACNTFP